MTALEAASRSLSLVDNKSFRDIAPDNSWESNFSVKEESKGSSSMLLLMIDLLDADIAVFVVAAIDSVPGTTTGGCCADLSQAKVKVVAVEDGRVSAATRDTSFQPKA